MSGDTSASVRARLLNEARRTDQEFNRVLTRFGLERFMYRLSRTADADRFMLKGAILLCQWDETLHRHTKDVDFLMFGDPDEDRIRGILKDACAAVCRKDGCLFDPSSIRIDEIRASNEYAGYRAVVAGALGTVRLVVRLDIAFGDAVVPPPEVKPVACLLHLPAPSIQHCPITTVIAEKTETILRLGAVNTRLKDYFDLQRISRHRVEGELLMASMRATFDRRRTTIPGGVPDGLSDEFASRADRQKQWVGFLVRMRVDDAPLPRVVERLRRFLMPPLVALDRHADFKGEWAPDRGWSAP